MRHQSEWQPLLQRKAKSKRTVLAVSVAERGGTKLAVVFVRVFRCICLSLISVRVCGLLQDEPAVQQDEEDDSRRALVLDAINYVVNNRVESWNSRPSAAAQRIILSRLQLVHLWKKTNTRGGSFQMKKMNHVAGAVLAYEPAKGELKITLTVVEGDSNDE